MAFGTPSSLGTTTDKTAGTTIVHTLTASASAGDLVVVAAAFDNAGTTDGETSQLSIADSQGNTWVKVRENTETSGVANDGVTGAWWFSVLTTGMSTSDTITVTSSSSRTASSIIAAKCTIGSGNTVEQADGTSEAVTQAASGQPGAISTSGMTSEEHLHLLAFFTESVQSISAWDTMTALLSAGTTGGGAATNIGVRTGYHIGTNTGLTADITAGSGSQHTQVLIALREVASGGQTVNPTGLASASSLGAVTIVPGGTTVSVSGKASSSSFGTVTIAPGGVTVSVSGLASASSLGAPSVSAGGGSQTVNPTGLASAASFGAIEVDQAFSVSGLASASSLGAPTVTPGGVTASVSGIASASSFSAITIVPGGTTVAVSGLASASQLGVIDSVDQAVSVSGLASASQHGVVAIVVGATTVAVAGLASSSSFGAPAVSGGSEAPFDPATRGGYYFR